MGEGKTHQGARLCDLVAFTGIKVTGQYEVKTGFSWVKVMVKNPELQVHATPEHVVVTRNRRSSEYKWMKTMFSTLPK